MLERERNKEGEKKPRQTCAPLSKSNGFRLVAVERFGKGPRRIERDRNVKGARAKLRIASSSARPELAEGSIDSAPLTNNGPDLELQTAGTGVSPERAGEQPTSLGADPSDLGDDEFTWSQLGFFVLDSKVPCLLFSLPRRMRGRITEGSLYGILSLARKKDEHLSAAYDHSVDISLGLCEEARELCTTSVSGLNRTTFRKPKGISRV